MAEEEKIEQHIIADRTLIRTARIISGILTPFSIPFLAFLVLFLFSYLRIMPLQYKLIVLGIVYCFTILMPTMTIFLFRKVNGFARQDLSDRKKRYVPILLTIISYVFCLMMMHKLNIPWYMTGIILASLVVLVICIFVNLKWKPERTHGRHGRYRRRTGLVQCALQLQPGVVALPLHPHSRDIRLGTHHPATSHAGRSPCRLYRRFRLLAAGAPPAQQRIVPYIFILNIVSILKTNHYELPTECKVHQRT